MPVLWDICTESVLESYILMVWDGENQASVWSETASFETGLLEREDWKGTWIGQGEDYENQELAPVLVGEFEVADLEQVVCARAYISGLGVFLADMNGQKLSDAFLSLASLMRQRLFIM